MQNKWVHPQGCLHSSASKGTASPIDQCMGKEMLILPSNTLPFTWDFSKRSYWALLLLMFRGPKRVKGLPALGNWYSQNSIIPMLNMMVWPDWTDKVHQRKRQRNVHIIVRNWGYEDDNCFPVPQSYSLDQTACVAAKLPTPKAPYPHATDRRGQRNFGLQKTEVKE